MTFSELRGQEGIPLIPAKGCFCRAVGKSDGNLPAAGKDICYFLWITEF
jgi:hypothetical protein